MSDAMSLVIVWEFRVRPGHVAAFEAVYGPEGDWARLFARSPAYAGTELLRDPSIEGRYLTLDRWASLEAFEELRRVHAADYEALDATCEAWTEAETKIGVWVG